MKRILTALLTGKLLFSLSPSSFFPSPAYADDYVPRSFVQLPEPRYVTMRQEEHRVGNKMYVVPIVEDRWDGLKRRKERELADLIDDGSCKISGGIECIYTRTDCVEREQKDPLSSMWKEKHGSIFADEPRCLKEKQEIYRAITAHYGDMENIRAEDGLLNDDDICFTDTDGMHAGDYCIDTKGRGAAVRAARLLAELQFISQRESEDLRRYSQNGTVSPWDAALKAEYNYKMAEIEYDNILSATDCVIQQIRERGYPLQKNDTAIDQCVSREFSSTFLSAEERTPTIKQQIMEELQKLKQRL